MFVLFFFFSYFLLKNDHGRGEGSGGRESRCCFFKIVVPFFYVLGRTGSVHSRTDKGSGKEARLRLTLVLLLLL